jgi:ribosomal protein S18 acetylase RimI-like enzyme
MVTQRDYAGDADMALLQALAVECWRRAGPLVSTAVGDPAWWMYQHLDKLAEVDVRLWLDADRCVAWGWLWRTEGTLLFLVHPHSRGLLADVLDWAGARDVGVLEHDHDSIALLEQHRYSLCEGLGWMNHMLRAWPYRADLDHVVVAPNGSFAAFCLCWLDEQNAVGELEPVGTHPDHRRRGLATAVCSYALARLRDAGARTALVYSKHGYGATALYSGLGFRSVSRHLQYRREQHGRSERLQDG